MNCTNSIFEKEPQVVPGLQARSDPLMGNSLKPSNGIQRVEKSNLTLTCCVLVPCRQLESDFFIRHTVFQEVYMYWYKSGTSLYFSLILVLNFLPFLILRKWGTRSASSANPSLCTLYCWQEWHYGTRRAAACNSTPLFSPRTSHCLLFQEFETFHSVCPLKNSAEKMCANAVGILHYSRNVKNAEISGFTICV